MQSTDMNINVAQLIQGFPYICLPALTFPSMLVTISAVQSMYRAGRYAVALQECSFAISDKRTRGSGQQNGGPCEISLTCKGRHAERMDAARKIQCGIFKRPGFAKDQARSLPFTAQRSTSSKTPCVSSASTAAGIAPASSMSLSFSARPMVMRSP